MQSSRQNSCLSIVPEKGNIEHLGEGFISLTFPIIRQGFCYRLVWSHHSLFPDFRSLGSNFATVPLLRYIPYLTQLSPSHLASGFSGQRRARATSASSTTLLTPSDWFVCGLFLFCSLARCALLPPFLSLLPSCSLLCLDFLTKDCQGFQLFSPSPSPLIAPFFPLLRAPPDSTAVY